MLNVPISGVNWDDRSQQNFCWWPTKPHLLVTMHNWTLEYVEPPKPPLSLASRMVSLLFSTAIPFTIACHQGWLMKAKS